MSKGVLTGLVALGLLLFPEDARVGSYGTYTLSRKGFTIAREIRIGEMSNPEREAALWQERERAAASATRPLIASLDAWFMRVCAARDHGVGWLDALDTGRETPADGDYRMRLPGPVLDAKPSEDVVKAPAGKLELYIHMKAKAALVAAARALAGVALGACAVGEATLEGPRRPLAERISWGATGFGEQDQPWVLAHLLFESCGRKSELEALAVDTARPSAVRALARWLRLALDGQSPAEADWVLLENARLDDPRPWVWALSLGPAGEQAARVAELSRRLPLDDDASFRTRFGLDAPR